MLNVAGYYPYFSVLDESLCVFFIFYNGKRTDFMVRSVLILIISIRGVHEPSMVEVHMAICEAAKTQITRY
jgi:hypothetical protein